MARKWVEITVDLTNGSNQVVVNGYSASTIPVGWIFKTAGHEPLYEVASGTALSGGVSTLTLIENYSGPTTNGATAVCIPTVADLVAATKAVTEANAAHNSLLGNLYDYTNTTGTVTFTDAAGGQVTLDTLPKIINDFQTQDATFNTASIDKSSGSAYFTVDTGSASDTGVWIKENGVDRFRLENAAAGNFFGLYNYATSNYDFKIGYDGWSELAGIKDVHARGVHRFDSGDTATYCQISLGGPNAISNAHIVSDNYRLGIFGSATTVGASTRRATFFTSTGLLQIGDSFSSQSDGLLHVEGEATVEGDLNIGGLLEVARSGAPLARFKNTASFSTAGIELSGHKTDGGAGVVGEIDFINRVTGSDVSECKLQGLANGRLAANCSNLVATNDLTVGGITSIGTFIVSTLPSASAYPDGVAKVTNDTNGHVMVMSNGTIWRRVFDNNAPST